MAARSRVFFVFVTAVSLLCAVGIARAAEPARSFPTPLRWRAWAPDLRRADSLLWAYRAADAQRAASELRARARREGAEWPEMASGLIAAASEALVGHGEQAERSARAVQALARKLGEREYDRRAMRWLAFALEAQSRSSAAESTYRALLRAAVPARDTLHMGAAHLGIGYATLQRGALPEARRHYERAVPLLLRARNPVLHATARVGLARTLDALGELEAEKRVYLEVLAQAQREQVGRNEVDALVNLGAIAYAQGDAERAVRWWTAAVARQRVVPSGEAGAMAVGNLALALNDLGRWDEANALLDSTIARARAARLMVAVSQLEVRRGEQLLARQRPGEALEAFRRAERELSLDQAGPMARARIGVLRAKARLESSADVLAYGRSEVWPLAAKLDGIERAELLLHLGDVERGAGDVRGALKRYEAAALELQRPGFDRSRLAVAWYRRGVAWRDLAEPDSAVAAFARGVREWEAWRTHRQGSRWQELKTFPFSFLPVAQADAMLAGHERDERRLAAAWTVVQAGRSRAVLDRLSAGAPAGPDTRSPSLASVQARLLAPGDVLLDLHTGERTTLLFVVTRSSARLVRLAGADTLAVPLRAWYALLAAPPSPGAPASAFADTRAALARLLFGAAGPELRAARRVLIAPDGVLALVPLEDLARVAAGERPGAPMREVWRISSPGVLASLRARTRPAEMRVLAWRGADDAARGELRGAEAEVRLLERRYAGVTVRDGRRAAAAPDERALSAWSVLHFATHGRALEQSPWESGLLCADSAAAGESAWLTARRIAAMRLPARLAFLSGCETAGGRALDGEGVAGLTNGFLSAGVGCVVSSLWAVDDAATARLAEVFYARLAAGASAAAALEGAREALRRDPATAHPHWWAGFVVSGDASAGIPLKPRGSGRLR
ncbi:MAG: CHAT domain-containing protein [Candidatus Eisenbacteria bacterium]|uniref:CHAT domain-containing protein n=1 Tax=Eiseniibacteriota bacterium TaxID=2212470 RepID=A0A933SF35_UNCEI|nr:CHAT domain-containing protein [Candidatus Eisenbacteria bacterium]